MTTTTKIRRHLEQPGRNARVLIWTIAALTILAVLYAAGSAIAANRTVYCGHINTGEPVLHPHGIALTGFATCSTQWTAIATLQIETAGTWNTPLATKPQSTPTYPHGSLRNQTWLFGNASLAPYCAHNARVRVTFFDARTGRRIISRLSGTLIKSCPSGDAAA